MTFSSLISSAGGYDNECSSDTNITNDIILTKMCYKRDNFNFEIVNFPFLDGDVPRCPSYGVYISQLICFARVCSHVDDSNNRSTF